MMAAVVSSIYTTMVTTHFFNSINIRNIQLFNFSKLFFLSPLVLLVLYFIPGDKAEVRFKAFTFLELLLLAAFSIPYLKAARFRFDISMARKAIKIGIPTATTGLIGVAYGLSDRFIMEKFYPMTEMAILNLSLTVCGVISMMFSSFQGVWVPVFFKEKNRQAAYARVGKVARLLAAALGGIGLCMWLAIGICLWTGLFDAGYSAILGLLPLTILTTLFQCLQHMYANFYVYFEQTYVGTIAMVTVACSTVGLNLLLIPRFSYYGAGMAGLAVSICAFLGYYFYARRKCIAPV
jgi:O-antigen/teichoic acid export membrane protein